MQTCRCCIYKREFQVFLAQLLESQLGLLDGVCFGSLLPLPRIVKFAAFSHVLIQKNGATEDCDGKRASPQQPLCSPWDVVEKPGALPKSQR